MKHVNGGFCVKVAHIQHLPVEMLIEFRARRVALGRIGVTFTDDGGMCTGVGGTLCDDQCARRVDAVRPCVVSNTAARSQ